MVEQKELVTLFKIKKLEDKFMIYFVDKYGEEEELGELIIYPDIK